MLFLLIYEIPTSVFLNSLVIVLISSPKKVKVVHFLLCALFYSVGMYLPDDDFMKSRNMQ
jgi:hypothetical protein